MQRLYPPPPAGFVAPFAGRSIPDGWLACDGSAVSRSEYPELFAAIGTAYGAGDGSTTFCLPELRARFVLGVDANHPLASMAGEYEHALTEDEGPEHIHTAVGGNLNWVGGGASGTPAYAGGSDSYRVNRMAPSGKGKPHNNMPPYTAMRYAISTGQ